MMMREKKRDFYQRAWLQICHELFKIDSGWLFREPSKDAIDEACKLIASLRSLPYEPTEEMLIAARDWSLNKNGIGIGIGNDQAIGCWKAMYSASLQPLKDD